ncbi:class I SAM-dependent methyltransferase [bacterium]|nr:class I SAM-dependent methyltransferase [candidate division CSSED10-310 bacterium]
MRKRTNNRNKEAERVRAARMAVRAGGEPKRSYVREMFNRIAPAYDRINLIISLGQTSLWRFRALRLLPLVSGGEVLDLGCGTGAATRGLRRRLPHAFVIGADLAEGMVRYATVIDPEGIYLQADAAALPIRDNQLDAVVSFFTLRNFADRIVVLDEILRVLKPGGYALLLDAFPPSGPGWWKRFHAFWLESVIPRAAALVAPDEGYVYLGESILTMTDLARLITHLESRPARLAALRSFSLGSALALLVERMDNRLLVPVERAR